MPSRWQLPWMQAIVVGSMLRSRSGVLRVVRSVARYQNGDLRSVTCTIRHCSWTRRCYTVLNYTDLRILGYRLVRATPRRLRSRLDRQIRTEIHQAAWAKVKIRCCDVEGIP